MSRGLWVSPTEFVRFAEDSTGKSLAKQIATRDRSPDFSVLNILPNPDPILKRQGKDISVYRDLLSDAHVGGCVRRRVAAVKALEHGVEQEGAKSRTTKRIEAVFKRLPMGRIIGEMLNGALYGYQPMELIWGQVEGLTAPIDIIGKPPEWFLFGPEGDLRFRSRDHLLHGEALPPRKFLLPRQDADYNNPYGIGELSRCFWPATFKKGGLKFWVTFSEKYGTPWLVGKMPKNAPQNEVDALLDNLESMIADAVAAIPDDASVDIVESGSKGASAEVFNGLLMFCRAEISTALLGQNQTTETNSTNASATAGLEVTQDLRDGLADMVAEELNQLIGWICALNNLPGEPPRFAFWEQEEVDKAQAERDQILSGAGVRFSKSYWMRSYDLREDDIEDAPAPGFDPSASSGQRSAQPAPFPERSRRELALAEPDEDEAEPDGIDALIDEAMADWEPVLNPLFEPLRQALEEAAARGETAGELLARLPDLLERMDADPLADSLTRAAFSASLAAQAGLELGDE
ncbi:MAG: DUF935 family protein [Gammaproteobacteria bacterium]|nr:DUF935 family protein [Gammaproteobacteria bacterium]